MPPFGFLIIFFANAQGVFGRTSLLNSFECDCITVEFYDPLNLVSPFLSTTTMLYVNGTANVQLPATVFGNSYYIVVKHQNSIETWSKDPVLFMGNPIAFDFTTP